MFLPALFLSVLLPSGLPLHKGATWSWEISERNRGPRILRTVVALDSLADPEGTLWQLFLQDDPSEPGDSALLLVRADGSQDWKLSSPRLPWDPEPWQRGVDGWGHHLFTRPVSETRIVPPSEGLPIPLIQGSATAYSAEKRLPPSLWDPVHGPLRLTVGDDTTWRLVSHDGHPLTPSRDTLVLPAQGSSWSWRDSSWRGLEETRWELREIEPDSSGWARLRIWTSRRSLTEARLDTSTLRLRLDPRTGHRFPNRDAIPAPDEAWWIRLGDSILPTARLRTSYRSQTSTSGHLYQSSAVGDLLWLLPGEALTFQQHLSRQASANQSRNEDWTRTLTAINGKPVNLQSLSVTPASTPKPAFAPLARRFPRANVHWTDLRGRQGQVEAARLLGGDGAPKVLFLDATFPDGSRWQGSLLTNAKLGH